MGIKSHITDTISAKRKNLPFMQTGRQRETLWIGRMNDILKRGCIANRFRSATQCIVV